MSQIVIQPKIPSQFVVPPIASTSKHILRRRYEEVTPATSASTYSFSTNSRLEFVLSSFSDFIDFQHSFVRFEMTTDLTINGSDDTTRYLGVGGVHSLFREIRVEASNGVVLQRIPNYNKWYAMMSQALPQQYIENVGFMAADSMSGAADYAGLGGSSTQGAREYFVQTTQDGIVVCFQPALPLMNLGSMFPAFLCKGGIRVIFELENPSYSLVSASATDQTAGAGFAAANVQLGNPRYLISYVQPSQEILEQYIKQFNGDGVTYVYSNFQHFLNTLPGGTTGLSAFQLNANVRSAKAIYSVIQNVNSEVVSAGTAATNLNTFRWDSSGQFIKANLKSYNYYSGAQRFPKSTPVLLTTAGNCEALPYFLECVGLMGVPAQVRFHPYQWSERDSISGNTDSSKLILAARLSRGDDSWSGLDISLQPIVMELEFDSAYQISAADSTRYFHTFIESDLTLTLSKDGIMTRV